ncbi:MAG: acyl-CoA dehydrogenase [Acidimicrobiia bacterium]|nr:acyl-CoA dehydrogenase [Acidimicrobiia bacterium]
MRFAFDAEQLEFRDAARNLLEKECPASAVRSAWSNDTGRVPGLWDRLVEMGAFELDEVDSVLVLEETGRACVPEPVVEAWALARTDATLALAGSPFALYADTVEVVVAQRGADLLRAVVGERRLSVDGSRRLFEVTPTDEVLDASVHVVAERAAVAAAAQLVGLAQHMLDLSVAYAGQREQFGKPVGSFQAVKHHLADAALRLEFARPCVHRAAWVLANADVEGAEGPAPVQAAVSLAKAEASEAALLAARKALQVHGAIGYTVEYDLHMWMKRAWALAAAWGDAAWHRNRVKGLLLKGTIDG